MGGGPAITDALRAALHEGDDPRVRWYARAALARLGDQAAFNGILRALHATDPRTFRELTVLALVRFAEAFSR